jgi:predicted XRE-type DNA-binding protein
MSDCASESHTGRDNVFRDFGFPEAEAQDLLLREDLVIHIRKVVDQLCRTQAEAATTAALAQPRINYFFKNCIHALRRDARVTVPVNLGDLVQLKLKKVEDSPKNVDSEAPTIPALTFPISNI